MYSNLLSLDWQTISIWSAKKRRLFKSSLLRENSLFLDLKLSRNWSAEKRLLLKSSLLRIENFLFLVFRQLDC